MTYALGLLINTRFLIIGQHSDVFYSVQVDQFLQQFMVSDQAVMDLSLRFRREMDKGLCRDTNPAAAVKMLPTFVRSTPDGTGNDSFTENVFKVEVNTILASVRPKVIQITAYVGYLEIVEMSNTKKVKRSSGCVLKDKFDSGNYSSLKIWSS